MSLRRQAAFATRSAQTPEFGETFEEAIRMANQDDVR